MSIHWVIITATRQPDAPAAGRAETRRCAGIIVGTVLAPFMDGLVRRRGGVAGVGDCG